MVVAPHPLRGELLHLVEVAPIILGQPFVANRSVEALDVGVLLRFAWLDVLDANAPAAGPVQQRGTDVLGPVVATNHFRFVTPGHDLRQHPDHSMRW